MAIEGKVAAILNERDLIVNKGSSSGVKEGMKFKVIGDEMPITDPDTGEVLGYLPREKIRVRIVEVHPKFSIGKTYQTYIAYEGLERGPLGIPLMTSLLTPRKEVTRVPTLRTDNALRLDPMDEESSFVKIGDPVVEAEDDQ